MEVGLLWKQNVLWTEIQSAVLQMVEQYITRSHVIHDTNSSSLCRVQGLAHHAHIGPNDQERRSDNSINTSLSARLCNLGKSDINSA